LFILQDVYFNPQWQQSRSLILRLRGAELGRQDFCFYHTMFKTIFSGHNKILGWDCSRMPPVVTGLSTEKCIHGLVTSKSNLLKCTETSIKNNKNIQVKSTR